MLLTLGLGFLLTPLGFLLTLGLGFLLTLLQLSLLFSPPFKLRRLERDKDELAALRSETRRVFLSFSLFLYSKSHFLYSKSISLSTLSLSTLSLSLSLSLSKCVELSPPVPAGRTHGVG